MKPHGLKLSIKDMGNESEEESMKHEEIARAIQQGKVIQGVFECAQILQMDADNVMACILNDENKCDISVKIQHKLIEAYCWENEIQVIKTGPEEKLSIALASLQADSLNDPEDCSCSIVLYPSKVDGRDIMIETDEWTNTSVFQHG